MAAPGRQTGDQPKYRSGAGKPDGEPASVALTRSLSATDAGRPSVPQYSGTSALSTATSIISSDSGFSGITRARMRASTMNGTAAPKTAW
jgi:hypothetical protein